jgi:ribokinase
MTRFDVVGFGALNVDKLYKVDHIAAAEQESHITAHAETCGGSAANAVVGLARLGCKVGFIGKVAGDREGELLLADFERECIDTSGVIRVGQGDSGQVLGFVDEEGERALYIDSGVNDMIEAEEIEADYVSQTQFLHLTSFVGDKSFQTQKNLLKSLPSKVKVSFDPGAIYARKGFLALEPIFQRCHIAMPNALELEQLTGENDYHRGADWLMAKGVKIVVVKLGVDGCYVTDRHEQHHIKAFKVQAADTTGAGDAFCAGFLYGLLHDKNLFDCGRFGNFVASRCVMKMGARAGLPYAADLALLK